MWVTENLVSSGQFGEDKTVGILMLTQPLVYKLQKKTPLPEKSKSLVCQILPCCFNAFPR